MYNYRMPEQKRYMQESIFWVETDRISPNPYQPRRTFDEAALASLAESIRQYGVLQPLTVTRKETEIAGEGIRVEYELIAGERRLRAAKLAGIAQVPVVIRSGEDDDRLKLELAIIENLQREDLNPIDRATAFNRLAVEFGLKHAEIGKRVGKSREYVSNTLRILLMPQEMQEALARGEINEGHTRPLLMLMDKPEEQRTLFQEITLRKLTVRDAEQLARRVAVEKSRKGDLTPELILLERELTDALGTRVRIEKKEQGGKLVSGKLLIDFFSADDLVHIHKMIASVQGGAAATTHMFAPVPERKEDVLDAPSVPEVMSESVAEPEVSVAEVAAVDPVVAAVPEREDDDMYSIRNFSL